MFESQPESEVEALLASDEEFRKLFRRHQELDKQVLDAELGTLPLDDVTLLQMKREKLHAKDRLTRMFASSRAPA
ncbi:MAG: YdcH family protein [Steroidobacteraceae bacterium]|nr:YdcH family protein [Steroidobacteraceae bacterium]